MRWGTQDRVKVCKGGDLWFVTRRPAGLEVLVSWHRTWEKAMKAALKLVGLA